MTTSAYQNLKERGYIYQCTDFEAIEKALTSPVTFYLGIDPTANSLHIGHFFALMMFRYLQDAGHKGILLIGGATALVGDPSGKSDMRKMLTKEEVAHNLEEVKTLAARFIKVTGENPAIIVNNADWLNAYSFVDFMRDVGIHFNINRMLATDAYSKRLEEGGLTFLEMSYMLMQSYDFVYLNKEHGCTLQIGGSDQWANIVAGTALGRKLHQKELFGLTCPLLLTKEGKKMGKTESGTLWVARDKTTAYDFYQYFYNVHDDDTEVLLRLFTRVPLSEIKQIVSDNIIEAKRLMAYEITKLVHGAEEADKVTLAVNSLFGKSNTSASEDAPSAKLNKKALEQGVLLLDLVVSTGFIPSKSEARRLISQGGMSVNGIKVDSIDFVVNTSHLQDGYTLLKKGKKNFLKVIWE